MSSKSSQPIGIRAVGRAAGGHFPRVLIIGYNFDLLTGGGITLTNLFREWPREKLAVAAFDPCEVDPAPCARQYLLGSDEQHWVWPVSLAIPGVGHPSIPDLELRMPAVSKTSAAASQPPALGTGGASRTVATAGLRWLGGADVLKSLSCSRRLREWARDVQPDLIYTQLASLGMIRLVTQLADGLSLPIALHIMDDWPSVIYDRGLLGPHLRAKTDRSFRALVARASATLAISQRMADVYRLRFGDRSQAHGQLRSPSVARHRAGHPSGSDVWCRVPFCEGGCADHVDFTDGPSVHRYPSHLPAAQRGTRVSRNVRQAVLDSPRNHSI